MKHRQAPVTTGKAIKVVYWIPAPLKNTSMSSSETGHVHQIRPYLPRAQRRRDLDVLPPKVFRQHALHPPRPAMPFGDERYVLYVVRAFAAWFFWEGPVASGKGNGDHAHGLTNLWCWGFRVDVSTIQPHPAREGHPREWPTTLRAQGDGGEGYRMFVRWTYPQSI